MQHWSSTTAEGFHCVTLGGDVLQDSLIQSSRADEQFGFWPHLMHHWCVGYESDAALTQQILVVV